MLRFSIGFPLKIDNVWIKQQNRRRLGVRLDVFMRKMQIDRFVAFYHEFEQFVLRLIFDVADRQCAYAYGAAF